jgi:hypothetical protein
MDEIHRSCLGSPDRAGWWAGGGLNRQESHLIDRRADPPRPDRPFAVIAPSFDDQGRPLLLHRSRE